MTEVSFVRFVDRFSCCVTARAVDLIRFDGRVACVDYAARTSALWWTASY